MASLINCKKIISYFFIFIFWQTNALSQVIDSIYYDWVVYEYYENGDRTGENKKCYINSRSKNSITSHTAKRKPYIMITRFFKTDTEEISIYSGYEYKLSSGAYILINDDQFRLFTNGNMAWFNTKKEDKKIIELMLRTDLVKVRSDSSVGTYAIDEYSTKGLNRAYARMKELCSKSTSYYKQSQSKN